MAKRQNSLLVEIIIAVLFFALSATVILDVFATAYRQSAYADACNAAAAEAQNLSERVYICDDPEALLREEGFVEESGAWQRNGDGYVLDVRLGGRFTEAGELRTVEIRALQGERELISLPCVRYIPGEVAR